MTSRPPVSKLITERAERIGTAVFIEECVALMGGADRSEHVDTLRGLTGHEWQPGDAVLDPGRWHDYWVRTWGARGLLHVWSDDVAPATAAVQLGLDDQHWRPAEMCLKVVARYAVAGTGDGAARLVANDLPRVRASALRALAVVGDVEHVGAVLAALDDESVEVRHQAQRAHVRLEDRLDLGSRE